MACYRNGGCGPYEGRSCTECPASSPDYKNPSKKTEPQLVQFAALLATMVHDGQVDKEGIPYINHPVAVASYVETAEAKIVAYLHDAIEDGDGRLTIERIRDVFGKTVADAVTLLTHDKSVPYFDYIRKIKANPLARTVKLADLKHNMSPDRKGATESMLERYRKATAILEEPDLLPCPLCGYEAILETWKAGKGLYEGNIHCNNCLCSLTSITYDSEKELITDLVEGWNRRETALNT